MDASQAPFAGAPATGPGTEERPQERGAPGRRRAPKDSQRRIGRSMVMNTQRNNGQSLEGENGLDQARHGGPSRHGDARARVIRRGAAAVAVLLAFTIVAAGCGKHALDQTTSANGAGDAGVSSAQGEPAVLASTSTDVAAQHTGTKLPEAAAPQSSDALPPEVDAAVVDSTVTPGSVVEISALASNDVVDMGLSDGVGKEQPFSYDSTMNVWRALYRVPIRTPKDRLGLAVTATNQTGHWRRVWVFLDLQK
jgi:hypothetical protein